MKDRILAILKWMSLLVALLGLLWTYTLRYGFPF